MKTQSNPYLGSLLKLEEWSVKNDYKAYDTFDGLSSPLSPIFTLGGVPFLKQCWQQGIRRFPLNLRPLVGIKKNYSSKGMGFYARGYLMLHQITGDDSYLERMRWCLDWLIENRCPEFKGNAWGNHFDYQARGGRIPKGTPTIVWTSLIAHAFLDAFEYTNEEKYLEMAVGAAQFSVNELGWIESADERRLCLNYTPGRKETSKSGVISGIHNSNVLGAGMMARVHTFVPDDRYLEIGKKSVRFTVEDQLENGAWNYGAHPMHHWVDSFHTAYNLDSINWYISCSGDNEFAESLQRGHDFWINTFFGDDGTPRYYDYKTRPLDIQCASQGIESLVKLRHLNQELSLPTAKKVAQWTIDNMQDSSGYFYYRKYPIITNTTPTLHWGQATMFTALAILARDLEAKSENSGDVEQSEAIDSVPAN